MENGITYKSLEQAKILFRDWGKWGGHQFYLGHPGKGFMIIAQRFIGWALIIGFVWVSNNKDNVLFMKEYGNLAFLLLHYGFWAGVGLLLWVRGTLYWDGVALPTMVYKANAGTTKIINPVTSINGQ